MLWDEEIDFFLRWEERHRLLYVRAVHSSPRDARAVAWWRRLYEGDTARIDALLTEREKRLDALVKMCLTTYSRYIKGLEAPAKKF